MILNDFGQVLDMIYLILPHQSNGHFVARAFFLLKLSFQLGDP